MVVIGHRLFIVFALLLSSCKGNLLQGPQNLKEDCSCERLQAAVKNIPATSVAWTNWTYIDSIHLFRFEAQKCKPFTIAGSVATDGGNGPVGKTHLYNINVQYGVTQPPGGYSTGELVRMKKPVKSDHTIYLFEYMAPTVDEGEGISLFSIENNQVFNYIFTKDCSVKYISTGRY